MEFKTVQDGWRRYSWIWGIKRRWKTAESDSKRPDIIKTATLEPGLLVTLRTGRGYTEDWFDYHKFILVEGDYMVADIRSATSNAHLAHELLPFDNIYGLALRDDSGFRTGRPDIVTVFRLPKRFKTFQELAGNTAKLIEKRNSQRSSPKSV